MTVLQHDLLLSHLRSRSLTRTLGCCTLAVEPFTHVLDCALVHVAEDVQFSAKFTVSAQTRERWCEARSDSPKSPNTEVT